VTGLAHPPAGADSANPPSSGNAPDPKPTPSPSADPDDSVIADRITVALLAVLRAGTIGLGIAETSGSSVVADRVVIWAALALLAVQSAVVFGLAARRLREHLTPAIDPRVAHVETVAGVAGLLIVAAATPPALRTSSTFWIEPYTVISAIVIAGTARRVAVGAIEAVCLMGAYLLGVLVLARGATALPATARATAWTNAISYLPFYAVGAIGFAVLRSVLDQTDALRRLLGRLAGERARIAAATSAYQIGHDIPKALLREVRRGRLRAEELRPWAEQYREDLVRALSGTGREQVDLPDELTALAAAFAATGPLRAELGAIRETPDGAPVLLIAEATRELLNNATYHAYGYAVTLTARSSSDRVVVAVHNDGPGVDPTALASAWSRKQGTLHQLQAAGGRFQIRSDPGSSAGTTVTLTWPGESS
jgi:hypothetical protein